MFSLAISVWSINVAAQTPAPVAQTAAELRAKLETRTGISLAGAKMRGAARSIAANGRTSLALDRRVDPDAPVELTLADTSLDEVWRSLAACGDLGFATLGPLVYVGPKSTARDLNTLAALRRDDAQRAPPALKTKLLRAELTQCDAPCDTRELWSRLTAVAGLTTRNLERMPFDLWPAIDWAPLPAVDRLSLVAAQFDLTFKIDPSAGTLTLEPLPAEIALTRSYTPNAPPQVTLARFRTLAPEATVRQVGAKIEVVGKYEDHERISGRAPQAGVKPAVVAPPGGVQVYTLRWKDQPLGAMIRVFQEKHKLKIRVDDKGIEAAGISLDGRTSGEVKDATLEQLLRRAAEPLGLTARTVGDTVEIVVPTPK